MKRKQKVEKFGQYALEIAAKMALRDWEVMLSAACAPSDALASVKCTDGRKRITICLARDFFELSREEQRLAIVHELVHAHFAAMHNPLCDTLPKNALKFYVSAMEYGVDAVASLVASSMPLPPKL